jgi:hypothetical protein
MIITAGYSFSDGEQVTAQKLNQILDGAAFDQTAIDSEVIAIDGDGALTLATGHPTWTTGGNMTIAGYLQCGSNGNLGIYSLGQIYVNCSLPFVRLQDLDETNCYVDVDGRSGNLALSADVESTQSDPQVIIKIQGNELAKFFKDGELFLPDVNTAPSTPTDGGYLYVESGALKYIGSVGTITEIASA